jgi:hypothetical protein
LLVVRACHYRSADDSSPRGTLMPMN